MTTITYSDLFNYDSSPLGTSENAWGDLLAGVEQNAQYFQSGAIAPTGATWTGAAAELATGKFNETNSALIANQSNLTAIRGLLNQLNESLVGYQKKLVSYVDDIYTGPLTVGKVNVTPGYFMVTADGQVEPSHQFPSEATLNSCQQAIQDHINGIVSQAQQEDASIANKLLQYLPKGDFSGDNVTTTTWHQEPTQQPRTIKAYGSLWQIAETEYGDGNLWTVIYNNPTNKAAIDKFSGNPSLIPVGMSLVIPPLAGSVGNPQIIPPGQGPS